MEIVYQKLVAWAFSSMIALQPISTPGVQWGDTYEHTADAIAKASIRDPFTSSEGDDPVFTAALMIEWAYSEARFDPHAIGDHGASFGLWQAHPDVAQATREELLDIDNASEIALRLFHTSFRLCRSHPIEERMAQYAYGRDCEHRLGLSRSRIQKARQLARTYKDFSVD